MITKADWDNAYSNTMPMVAVAVGILGVAISLLTLQRQPAQGAGVSSLEPPRYSPLSVPVPRVHYENGQYLVSVRSPGEWHELREFVQPDNPYLTHVIREALSG